MRWFLFTLSATTFAADLPPDKGSEIPESGKRPLVVTQAKGVTDKLPSHSLPENYKLELVAAAPLVTHPIMGCLDDKGRLFVGDGVGVNWNKAQLEANPPNRVLMLEDTDKDGSFDKSTIFADKMTFPQGACWLNGSLYVCSPPGLWKLTDGDNDGVAEKREMLVGGFEYTGNAADVHGPFLHPNGRLYWCHGRKGHKVTQKDGSVVHEGLACGIWSCEPDGSDVEWHSLGCGDNPVEVDFTPEGSIIGVQNLYYSQPRGDTIVHWLYGGVYERADQLKATEGLPRTMETMPVVYNYGHVAVSGSCFWKRSPFTGPLQFMVTHFNTQRLVRTELTPDGATYKARENEFLKINNPDVHFTDVMEEPDGSLLVIDTGGWFRIGCPSSLMAKSDLLGAVYRIRYTGKPTKEFVAKAVIDPSDIVSHLTGSDPQIKLQACEIIARNGKASSEVRSALIGLLSSDLDATLEHAVIYALYSTGATNVSELLSSATKPDHIRRLLTVSQLGKQNVTSIASQHLDSANPALARTALRIALANPAADEQTTPALAKWTSSPTAAQLTALEGYCTAMLTKPNTQKLVASLLESSNATARQVALQVISAQSAAIWNDSWKPSLTKLLQGTPSALTLDAIRRVSTTDFDSTLQALAADKKVPLTLRLKAIDAMKTKELGDDAFQLAISILKDPASSAAARIQAASMVSRPPLKVERLKAIAPLFGVVGPVELKELTGAMRGRLKDASVATAITSALTANPALASIQESVFRTIYATEQPEMFEKQLLPAIKKADEAVDAKKRTLTPLAEKSAAKGNIVNGKAVFESGRGTCIACHKIGDKGRAIGPDLSKIGAIRTERDIIESIVFPSNTLARDYEAHVIETTAGEAVTAVIKSHTAEGLLVTDVAGVERNLPHTSITSNTTLTTSLMPMGLDQTLPEKDLIDLVAYLRSLK